MGREVAVKLSVYVEFRQGETDEDAIKRTLKFITDLSDKHDFAIQVYNYEARDL